MLTFRERMPVILRNLRQARDWRVHDMVNWHRMVRPFREQFGGGPGFDLLPLVMDLGTRFCFEYTPAHGPSDRRAEAARPAEPPPGTGLRVGMFVDASDHLSGVSTTIGQWVEDARRVGASLSVHSCGVEPGIEGARVFAPVGALHVPLYDGLELHVPDVEEVMAHIAAQKFDVLHLSTPGPMGLLGLVAAKRCGIPVCGTYHTDFPAYALRLSQDPQLEAWTWRFMKWFYGQLDAVASPSRSTMETLIAHGFDPERQLVVGRGVNTSAFSPRFRSQTVRAASGSGRTKLLYVGRLSEEKNLYVLARAFRRLCTVRDDVDLIITGEGPYRAALECELADCPVTFTGALRGEALSSIYASSDLFVFPSETDTFGVVLIEAQASGVPVIVSSSGGPKNCVRPGETGWVLESMTPERLATQLLACCEDPSQLAAMRDACLRHAAAMTPERSFENFWAMHTQIAADPAGDVAQVEQPVRSFLSAEPVPATT